MDLYIKILATGVFAGGGLACISWLIGFTISKILQIMKG